MKVLIKGAFGNYNFGDDLLAYSICEYLHSLNMSLEITILSNAEYLRNLIYDVKIVSHDEIVGSFDLLIFAGGTQFASFKKNSYFSISHIKNILILLKNPNALFAKVRKKILGIKYNYVHLAIVGIGIGPFYTKDKYYYSSIKFLRNSNLLAVRDTLSEKTCLENSLKHIVGSDLVFSLPNSFWKNFQTGSNRSQTIAVIIRDWEYSEENASFIYQLDNLKISNSCINFISFCKKRDEKCIEYLKKNGHSESIKIWDPSIMTFANFLVELSEYDMFITARYHGAIIASLLKKPFIAIGIEPKLSMVADLFEMPCWNYPFDIEECQIHIKYLYEHYNDETQKIWKKVKFENEKNTLMMDNLSQLFKS